VKWSKWIENWNMTSLKINLKFLEMEWEPKEPDKQAAWDLYIELLTRVSTQSLQPDHGNEATALKSIYQLFDLTRTIIKSNGRDCIQFTRIAIIVLNQVVRPFTAKWHKVLVDGGFSSDDVHTDFRKDLEDLHKELGNYTKMLADMAGVEDLTNIEETL